MGVDYDFISDNAVGVSPEMLEAIARANHGHTVPYGDDDHTAACDALASELFERECRVFLVSTGTAANALALATLTPPWGEVFCHAWSHSARSECGAPEFYSAGAKLTELPSLDGKIPLAALQAKLAHEKTDVHAVRPSTLSLTQQTEAGTLYSLDEIQALCAVAKDKGLSVHMDGARFANAAAALDASPADLTWRAGVDVLSFGAGKNGAMGMEAIVLFRTELADELSLRRMRAGHLASKMRFLAAQFQAYLRDDLWLRNAAQANAMATRLHAGLKDIPGIGFGLPVQGNQLFAHLSPALLAGFREAGFRFYELAELGPGVVRMVTAFTTRPEQVDDFIARARGIAAANAA